MRHSAAPSWAYDVETTDWTRGLCSVAIREDGETVIFTHKTSDPIRRMALFQQSNRGTWFAHYGGIFDHLLMFRHTPPAEVILSGSCVLKARGTKQPGRPALQYRDTGPWWLASLEKVGKACGCAKTPDIDRSRLADMDLGMVAAYCEQDVKVLWAGINACRAFFDEIGARPAATSGGSAVSLMRRLDPDTWTACEQAEITFENHEQAQHRIRGGRTETRVIGIVNGPVYCYDIHSSYPASYFEGPLPVGMEPDAGTSPRGDWWGPCEWTQPRLPDGQTPPELQQGVDGFAGGVGSGVLRAWLTAETFRYLQECGLTPRRLAGGFRPCFMVPDFAAQFAQRMFDEKEGGGRNAFFAKVFLNSLHGKLGMGGLRESYLLDDRDDGVVSYSPHVQVSKLAPYQQPLAAAYILQRARIRWHRGVAALERAGFQVYYGDTDCIHTNANPSQASQAGLDLGPDIGQWGLENTATRAHYLASKMYYLEIDGQKPKVACKGIPKALIGQNTFYDALWGRGMSEYVEKDGLVKFKAGAEDGSFGARAHLTRSIRPVAAFRRPADPHQLQPGFQRYSGGFTWLNYVETET